MSARFQELDRRATSMGELVLRRRREATSDTDIDEVKLGDEFLMSSMFTVAETEMARLALSSMPDTALEVLVGGLGLGYTAQAVLEDPRVARLTVVEALVEVIDWHRQGLVPVGESLIRDHRCTLLPGDFFELVGSPSGFDPSAPDRRFHAIIVDIDHSPRHVLHPGHAAFYGPVGVRRLADRLYPGGVFALWSNDSPDDAFTAVLAAAFSEVEARIVTFDNPLQGREATSTVYLATLAPA